MDDQDCQVPFKFTGKFNKLTVKLDRPQLSSEDIKKLEQAQRNNKVSELLTVSVVKRDFKFE